MNSSEKPGYPFSYAVPSEKNKSCPRCGFTVRAGDLQCNYCGAQLGKNEPLTVCVYAAPPPVKRGFFSKIFRRNK